MYQVIDGKKISQEIKDELKEKVTALKEAGKEICLAVIQVGSDCLLYTSPSPRDP